MHAPPRNELCHVVVSDVGHQNIRAEMWALDQEGDPMLGAISPHVMLPDLFPVALGHVVETQGRLGRRQLGDQPLLLLPLGRLYFFSFAARRAFRRAVKPMTSHLEVVVPVRRAAVFGLVDGHGASFRVWLAMKVS